MANKITGPNAGGPRQFPIPTPTFGQFWRSAKGNMKLLWLIITVSLCLPAAMRASDDASPALVVMIDGIGRPDRDISYPLILVAAWPDGRIVWSEDQNDGGSPLLEGRIDPERIRAFLRKFEQRSVFEKDDRSLGD
jgi:hypothetical protein